MMALNIQKVFASQTHGRRSWGQRGVATLLCPWAARRPREVWLAPRGPQISQGLSKVCSRLTFPTSPLSWPQLCTGSCLHLSFRGGRASLPCQMENTSLAPQSDCNPRPPCAVGAKSLACGRGLTVQRMQREGTERLPPPHASPANGTWHANPGQMPACAVPTRLAPPNLRVLSPLLPSPQSLAQLRTRPAAERGFAGWNLPPRAPRHTPGRRGEAPEAESQRAPSSPPRPKTPWGAAAPLQPTALLPEPPLPHLFPPLPRPGLAPPLSASLPLLHPFLLPSPPPPMCARIR